MTTEINTDDTGECAVVVFSGGQDSTTCLGIALARFDKVHCIAFDYGQRHSVELVQARAICLKHKVPLKIVELAFMPTLVTSNLTNTTGDVNDAHPDKANLPSSFVPNRNALFLTLAHAYAQEVKASHVYTGVCQTDYSGYPDCRAVFISRLQLALNIGYETDIQIVTPLMLSSKAEIFSIAEEFGMLETVIEQSHTCYNGLRDWHEWGRGCGNCPACALRQNGYEQFVRTREGVEIS